MDDVNVSERRSASFYKGSLNGAYGLNLNVKSKNNRLYGSPIRYRVHQIYLKQYHASIDDEYINNHLIDHMDSIENTKPIDFFLKNENENEMIEKIVKEYEKQIISLCEKNDMRQNKIKELEIKENDLCEQHINLYRKYNELYQEKQMIEFINGHKHNLDINNLKKIKKQNKELESKLNDLYQQENVIINDLKSERDIMYRKCCNLNRKNEISDKKINELYEEMIYLVGSLLFSFENANKRDLTINHLKKENENLKAKIYEQQKVINNQNKQHIDDSRDDTFQSVEKTDDEDQQRNSKTVQNHQVLDEVLNELTDLRCNINDIECNKKVKQCSNFWFRLKKKKKLKFILKCINTSNMYCV